MLTRLWSISKHLVRCQFTLTAILAAYRIPITALIQTTAHGHLKMHTLWVWTCTPPHPSAHSLGFLGNLARFLFQDEWFFRDHSSRHEKLRPTWYRSLHLGDPNSTPYSHDSNIDYPWIELWGCHKPTTLPHLRKHKADYNWLEEVIVGL